MLSVPAADDSALQSGDVAHRYLLPNSSGSFKTSAVSILLEIGFLVFCRKLHNDICIKLQHTAFINNWLEAELSHKRVGEVYNTIFAGTCSRSQLSCSSFNLFGKKVKNYFCFKNNL